LEAEGRLHLQMLKKVDVYSFGVVLLELTTGKEANYGGEHGSLAEWARHHYQLARSIPDATDKSMRYVGYSDEIEVVFRLGVLCTAEMPSSRPTMNDVLQILVRCSEQTHHKTERGPEYEAAPLLLPKRGSRRKQLSNGSGIEIEEKTDFDRMPAGRCREIQRPRRRILLPRRTPWRRGEVAGRASGSAEKESGAAPSRFGEAEEERRAAARPGGSSGALNRLGGEGQKGQIAVFLISSRMSETTSNSIRRE
jgi:serine/threonine protein kinase